MRFNKAFRKVVTILLVIVMCFALHLSSFAWSPYMWENIESYQGSGHKSMILNMTDFCFFVGSTDYARNRNLVAEAARLTDMSYMGAGVMSYGVISPYHAKSNIYATDCMVNDRTGGYSLNSVKAQLAFLYELARNILSSGGIFNGDVNSYSSDRYYSVNGTTVVIPVNIQQRIVEDLSSYLIPALGSVTYNGAYYNMGNPHNQGYAILGVYLHLLQDVYAHRAKVTSDMIYYSGNGNSINANDFTNDSERNDALDEIALNGGMPMIRLKDYLHDNLTANFYYVNMNSDFITATATGLNNNQKYEDNPFYYINRYYAGLNASYEQLANALVGRNFTFSDWNIPLM